MANAVAIEEMRRRLEMVTAPQLQTFKDALLAGAFKVVSRAEKRMINLDAFREADPAKVGVPNIREQVAILSGLIEEYKGKNFPFGESTLGAVNAAAAAAPRSAPPVLLEAVNAKAGAAAAAAPVLLEAEAAAAPAPDEDAPSECDHYFDPCTKVALPDFPTLERRVRELKKAQDTTPVGLFGIKNDTSSWDFLTTVFVDKSISLDDMVSFKIGAGSQAGSDIFEVLCRLFVVFGGVPDVDPLRGPFRFIRKLEASAAPTIYETTEAALRAITCKATSATGVSDITLLRTGAAAGGVRSSESYCESLPGAGDTTATKTYAMSVKWYKNEKNAEHYDLEKLYTAMARIVPEANKPASIVVFLKSKVDFEIAHNRAYRQYVRGLSNNFYGWVEDVRPFLQSFRHTLFEAAEQRRQTPVEALRTLYFTPTAKPMLSLQLHQEIIVKKINDTFEHSEDNKYLIGVLPRGGKTYIAGGIVREYMRRRAGTPLKVFWLTAAPGETFSQVGADLIQKFEDFKEFDFINVKDAGKRIHATKPHQFFFMSSQLITQEESRQRTEGRQMRTVIDSLMTGALKPDLVFFDEAHATGAGDHTKSMVDSILDKHSRTTTPFIFLTATYFNILFEYKILRENTFLWDYTDVLHTRGIGTDSDQADAIENLRSRFGAPIVNEILERRIAADDSYEAMAKAYIGFPDLYFISASFQEEALARFATQNQYHPDSGFSLDTVFAIKPLTKVIPSDPKSPTAVKDVLTAGNRVRADAWKMFANLVNPRNVISLLTPGAVGFTDAAEGGQPLTVTERGVEPSILGRIDSMSRAAESRFRLDESPTLLMFLPVGGDGSSIFHLQCAWASLLRSHPWWAARYEVACVVDGRKLSDAEIAEQSVAPPPAAEGVHIVSTNTKDTIIALEREVHTRGRGLVVLAGDKLSMGVSLPCTDVVFLFNSTKAPDDIIQKMYRALTPSPGKKAAFVVDLNPVRTLAATYGYIRAANQDSKTQSEILRIIYDTYSWDADVFEYSLTKGGDTRPLRFQEHLKLLFDKAEKDKTSGYRIDEDFKDLEKRLNTNLRRGDAMTGWVESLSRVFTERPAGTELQIELRDGATAKVKGGRLAIRVPRVEAAAGAATGGAGTGDAPVVPVVEIIIENIVEVVADFVKYLAITTTKPTLLEAISEYETDADFKRNVTQMLITRFNIPGLPQDVLNAVLLSAIKKIAVHASEEMFKQMKRKIDDTEIRRNAVLKIIHKRITPRNRERKDFGEVFTPIELVDTMLSHLPDSIWSDHTKKWIDPANGIGNFPVVAFYKLDEGLAGWEPNAKKRRKHIIENMLYMIELQGNNSRIARRIFSNLCEECKPNIWTIDSLTVTESKLAEKGWPTKYDVVMGNPPFQRGRNMMFYVYFIDLANTLLKDKGDLIYLIPNKILIPNRASEAMANFNPSIIYHTVNTKYFPTIGTTICGVVAKKEPYTRRTKIIFSNGEKIIDLENPTPTQYDNIKLKEVSDKIFFGDDREYLEPLKIRPDKPHIYISRVWVRYSPDKPKGGAHVFQITEPPSSGGDGRYFIIPPGMNKSLFIWYLSRSEAMRLITKIYAGALNVPAFIWNIIPYVPLKTEDNHEVYSLLGLNTGDISIIKECLKDNKESGDDEEYSSEGGARRRFNKTRKIRRM